MFSWVRVAQFFFFFVVFYKLLFVLFSFGHCNVCGSIVLAIVLFVVLLYWPL